MSDHMQADPDSPEPLGPPESELRDALLARFSATPMAAVDWDAQARRIAEAARFRLAERSRRGWQRPAARHPTGWSNSASWGIASDSPSTS